MGAITVRVENLDEFQRALRNVGTGFGPALARGLRDIGTIVTTATRPVLPRRSGRMAGTLRTRATSREATIEYGGPGSPQAGWIEFGGTIRHVGAQHSHQAAHEIPRPFVREGRHLFPSYRRREGQVQQEMDRLVEELAQRAGLY